MAEWLARMLRPEGAAYNDVALRIGTPWSDPTLLLVGLVLGAAWLWSLRGAASLSGARRMGLAALRLLSALVLLGLLLRPGIELRTVSDVPTRVVVLMDASRSMALPYEASTRLSAAQAHWQRLLPELKDRSSIRLQYYSFGEQARYHSDPAEANPPEATGRRTDLGAAIREVKDASSTPLGAVVLYSDGDDTEGLNLQSAQGLGAAVGAPVYSFGFPEGASPPDLAIESVRADDFAFVHNRLRVELRLRRTGLAVARVPVTLRDGNEVLQTREAVFAGDEANVEFSFVPRRMGKHIYHVSVPVQAQEKIAANNARSFVVKVIRDRIRVLHVVGRPSWDERFLREHLKSNPSVDLVSFFILRSTTDLQRADQDELALIPFPVNELFTRELASFDVLIYQNFDYRPYRMAPYLNNIRQYILDGGSFLMVGGDQSFDHGGYAYTPLNDLLPVRLRGAATWDPAPFVPRRSAVGRTHPILEVQAPGAAGDPFRSLPALQGANVMAGLAPGAEALLVHPSLPGNPPVVAIREAGRGRTMAVATDSTWRWRFEDVGRGGDGAAYRRFWRNTLRWLIRDPDLGRVRIHLDASAVTVGDPIQAEVEALGTDYRGAPEVPVALRWVDLDGQELGRVAGRTQASGRFRGQFVPDRPGRYLLRAEADFGAGADGSGQALGGRAVVEEPVIVRAVDRERARVRPRPELLSALSAQSGGRFTAIDAPPPEIRPEGVRRVNVHETRVLPLWSTAAAIALLVAVLSLEWVMRRRWGAR